MLHNGAIVLHAFLLRPYLLDEVWRSDIPAATEGAAVKGEMVAELDTIDNVTL